MWLHAKADADLLDGNYDSAITSLQRALETQQNAPGSANRFGVGVFLARPE